MHEEASEAQERLIAASLERIADVVEATHGKPKLIADE